MRIQHQILDKFHGRFVPIISDKEAGYLKYTIQENGVLRADGTLIYDEYRSLKLGTPLFEALIKYLEENNRKVIPICPFIVRMFEKKPEYQYLIYKE